MVTALTRLAAQRMLVDFILDYGVEKLFCLRKFRSLGLCLSHWDLERMNVSSLYAMININGSTVD